MLIRTPMPIDKGMLMDMDYAPCYVWHDIASDIVVKIFEDQFVIGFTSFIFHKKALIIQKFVIRENYRRLGYGSEAMAWLLRVAERRKLKYLRMSLPESELNSASCWFLSEMFEIRRVVNDEIIFSQRLR